MGNWHLFAMNETELAEEAQRRLEHLQEVLLEITKRGWHPALYFQDDDRFFWLEDIAKGAWEFGMRRLAREEVKDG